MGVHFLSTGRGRGGCDGWVTGTLVGGMQGVAMGAPERFVGVHPMAEVTLPGLHTFQLCPLK